MPLDDPLLGDWPLVGRHEELGRIVRALERGGGHGVVIAGPAGVGKSRLAREAYATIGADQVPGGWIQATRSAASVPLGAFAPVLGGAVRSGPPLELMQRSVEAFRALGDGRPVVLAVDDGQLLDAVSAALLLHLTTQGAARVIVAVRTGEPCPDAVTALWKDGAAELIDLERLGDDAIMALVEGALDGPVEARVLRWVADTSEGNVLWARELVVGAVEAETLVRADGLWRLRGRPRVSRSLSELIGERLAAVTPNQRDVLELLALGEPLQLAEAIALTSEQALIDVERQGLINLDGGGAVRLSHPLFGEVTTAAMPTLRGRALRLRLAATLRERRPLQDDDALRIARLLLDVGAPIPSDLLLQAAGAANLAGDPELGAELGTRALADGGLPAAMHLARALTMRNRNREAAEVLADAQSLVAGHDLARDYLLQRVWVLYWGLRRPDRVAELLELAAGWATDPGWTAYVRRLGQSYDGAAPAAADAAAAEPEPSAFAARSLDAMQLLLGGHGDEAAALTRAHRPTLPLRDLNQLGWLGATSVVAVETGHDWAETEAYLGSTLRAAVRSGEREAAGIAAGTIAELHFLRGRYRDAARWIAESELHLDRQDTFGSRLALRSYEVGIALFTSDGQAASAALARLHELLGADPLPSQLPYVLRAEGWALRTRSDSEAARFWIERVPALSDFPIFAAQLLYEAHRAGGDVRAPLAPFAGRASGPLVGAYVAHVNARDGAELLAAAEQLAAVGARRYAMEAAVAAAAAFVHEGREDSGRRAANRARELFAADQGAAPPAVGAVAMELTTRESQIVGLARQGLTNAQIADQLVVSTRTVETHLYRAMQKLGVSNRRELT